MLNAHGAMLMGALLLAGCGGRSSGDKEADTGKAPATTGADTGTMRMGRMDSGGMGMSGMHDGMQGMGMMSMMQAHMDSMMRMSPAHMSRMMAMHQQVMSQMMDRMGGDMRQMQMSGTPDWEALTDSIKQDLAELPNFNGPALSSRMRGHADRVRRLLGMHEGMMKAMSK